MRASSWDYSQAGAYFVTTVTHARIHLFGSVSEGVVRLNPAGQMVEKYWLELQSKYPQIELDSFVVMPNHVHGILNIKSKHQIVECGPSLGDVMKWFKSMTTNAYIRGVKDHGWQRFDGKLWQPDYWDHIIRNDADLERIREYIFNNPFQWDDDPDNESSAEAWRPF